MGHHVFRLPDVGEGVAEAEIVAWHIKVGDRIEEDQPTVDVMTDKATVEMTTPVSGIVAALHGEVGQMVPVGTALIELTLQDEAASDQGAGDATSAPVARQEVPPPPAPRPQTSQTQAPLAAPATRRRAHEGGVDLHAVTGTGPDGRITPSDLDAVLSAGRAEAPVPPQRSDGVSAIRIVGLRRRIAEKMQESTRKIPHFSYVEEFDVTALETLRQTLNEGRRENRPKLTLLPFFMLAVVRSVRAFPQINARYDDAAETLHVHDSVHVGIATQTSGGLTVPVVRHAEALDLWQAAEALRHVTAAARDGTASRDMLSGSTITLSSLGALGGLAATPIINHPEVAIIGPNRMVDRPMVVNGQVAIRRMMNVSSSFDHRIIDGHEAARFVQALKRLIEQPALLFVDP